MKRLAYSDHNRRYTGASAAVSLALLPRCAFAFFLVWAIALAVLTGCFQPGGDQYPGLEEVEKQTTFRIVLPRYLPEGFGGFSIIPPIPSGERYTQVTMAFSGPQKELIQIMETDHPWGKPEITPYRPYIFREVKGIRIATLKGAYFRLPPAEGGGRLPGISAEWG